MVPTPILEAYAQNVLMHMEKEASATLMAERLLSVLNALAETERDDARYVLKIILETYQRVYRKATPPF